MCQQPSSQTRDAMTSSQVSREDEDNYSNKATSGSSDPGSDDLELLPTHSGPSEPAVERPLTRRFAQHLQAAQTDHANTTEAAPATSTIGGNSLMGLTLSPLPSAMLPSRKRSLGEVLGDETPPGKDKLSAEIDHLASVQRKKSRADGDPPTPRALLIVTRDPTTHPDASENIRPERQPERRSGRIRDTSRRGNPAASG
ncbi:hypothetical protein GGR55DRAFT_489048 [Xylaria sp. FL0064]|nr:hypothetical protein GGR55DRAFT_489048 [Xylaria sp. FL0064]